MHHPLQARRDGGDAQNCGEDGELKSRRWRALRPLGVGVSPLSVLNGMLTKMGNTGPMRSADLLCARILDNTGDERGAGSGRKGSWMSKSQAWISLRDEIFNMRFL